MDNSYFLYYLDSRLELDPDEDYLIGRSPGNHVLLPHISVSRSHARMSWSDSGFEIEDLDSTNGVWINNRKIQYQILVNGDKLKIGDFNLQFVVRSSSNTENVEASFTPTQTLAMERTVAELLQNVQDPELAAKIMDLKHRFEKKRHELADLAFEDPLTRVFNRRYFDKQLSQEFKRSKASGRQLSLVMIDIDHFKNFNDAYGHQAGDEMMRQIAGILCDSVRSDDTVARYGGEEIAVILPGVALEVSLRIAERFRWAVADYSLDGVDTEVTFSLAVAILKQSHNSPEDFLKSADEALYKAKSNGRNQVVSIDEND